MTSMTEQTVGKTEKWRDHGFFSDDGKEFVVVKPATSKPWMNFLGNTRFSSVISHTGGGFCYYLDPLRNRITQWQAGLDCSSSPGRLLYLKDNKTGEYWNQSGSSLGAEYQKWEARHGLGYTTIRTRVRDIFSQMTCFVPLDVQAEIWMIHIRNEGTDERDLSVYSAVEPLMGNAVDNTLAPEYYSLFNEVFYQNNVIWGIKNQWTKREQFSLGKNPGNLIWNLLFYFVSSLKVDSYDCDKAAFYGHARPICNPEGIEKSQLSNSSCCGTECIAALHHRITLKAGEEVRFQIAVGVSQKDEDVKPLIQKLLTAEAAAHELERVRSYWDSICTSIWLETPDEDINRAFNIWLKYQAMNQIHAGDSVVYSASSRTDNSLKGLLQSLLTGLALAPESARKKLIELTQYQFFEGDCAHSIVPLLMRGTRSGNSDHQLWLPFLVSHYCRETGDYDILDEKVSYHDKGEATVIEHCIRAIFFVKERHGSHGLPLILNGDFDEMLDQAGREGKGESVPLAMLLVHIMKRFLVIVTEKKNEALKARLMTEIERLTDSINRSCWDGSWYIRAFGDDQTRVGSSESGNGMMFLLPQVWAVISGVATRDRGQLLLNAIRTHLDCPSGTRYLYPPFSAPDQSLGIITRLSPGRRENAGTVKTAAMWRLMAECLYGSGDFVYEALLGLMSFSRFRENPDIFTSEPFLESEYIDGPESHNEGRSSMSWGGSAASWMFRLIHDWICGIRLEQRGMKIDPCIPGKWESMVIKKQYKGSLYHITIENKEHVSKGIKKIMLEGHEMTGAYIPVFGDGKVHNITVVMGRKEDRATVPAKAAMQVEKDEDRETGGLTLQPESGVSQPVITAEQSAEAAQTKETPVPSEIPAAEGAGPSEEAAEVPKAEADKAEADSERTAQAVEQIAETAVEKAAKPDRLRIDIARPALKIERPSQTAEEPPVSALSEAPLRSAEVKAVVIEVKAEDTEIKAEEAEIKPEEADIKSQETEVKAGEAEIRAEAFDVKTEEAEVKSEEESGGHDVSAFIPDSESSSELPPMPDSGETSGEQSSASAGTAMPPLPGEAESGSGEQPVQQSAEAASPTGDSEKNVEGLPVDMPSDRKP